MDAGGIRPATSKRYSNALHMWTDFLTVNGLTDVIDFDSSPVRDLRRVIMWFLYYLAVERTRTETQIATALQALQHSLRLDGYSTSAFQDPSVSFARRATREDPRLKHARLSLKRRLPVTFDMIVYLETLLYRSRNIDDRMTFIGVLLAFHFMLRVSEYCSDGEGRHALRTGDILFFGCDDTVYRPWDSRLLTLSAGFIISAIVDVRSSKADTTGKGRHLYITRSGSAESHLLDLILEWCTLAGFKHTDQVFLSRASPRAGQRKHLTRRLVSSALKRMAVHFGFDEAFFSSHSLRIGGMSCGTAANVSNVSLCRIAGWDPRSSSSQLYNRNVPDRGILSVLDSHQLDTSVALLSASDVQRMIPTALHAHFGLP